MDPLLFPKGLPRSMPDQLKGTMFDAPSVAVETSEDAAERVRGATRQAHLAILWLLLDHQSAAFEIARDAAWTGDYTRPRLWELMGRGLIERLDGKEGREKRKVKTPAGRLAFLYAITEKGRETLRNENRLAKT